MSTQSIDFSTSGESATLFRSMRYLRIDGYVGMCGSW